MKLVPPPKLTEAQAEQLERWREGVRRAVLINYVVDPKDAEGPGRFVVRRLEVYQSVAGAIGIRLVTAPLCIAVTSVVVGLGAIAVQVGNRRMFRGMHQRDLCPAQAAVDSTALRRAATVGGNPGKGGKGHMSWERVLAAEGMPAELDSARLVDVERARLNGSRLGKATDAFWKLDAEHKIIRLYMEGHSIREIVELTKLGKHVVHRALHRHGLTATEKGDV